MKQASFRQENGSSINGKKSDDRFIKLRILMAGI